MSLEWSALEYYEPETVHKAPKNQIPGSVPHAGRVIL